MIRDTELPPDLPASTAAHPDVGANTVADIPSAAVKFDAGKARWDLMPLDALDELAVLYTLGAFKYADRNWEKGFRWGRTFAAGMRHAKDWFLAKMRDQDGRDTDPKMLEICAQLGVQPPLHITQAIWNFMALLTFELRGVGEDDRPTLKEAA